jgi:heme exporter protein A
MFFGFAMIAPGPGASLSRAPVLVQGCTAFRPGSGSAKAGAMDVVVDNLAVARGGLPVLEGLSFRVPAGTGLILRGPNGAGKTTLLRTLAGLQPALAGTVAPGPEAMAYASHADGIKATLTVRENLGFWAALHRQDRVAQAIADFDLGRLADRPAGTLSAGQKRRLGLARMGVTGRPVWLMDEPTVSLDAGAVARFASAVRAHLAAGGVALIATHIDLGIESATLDLGPFKGRPQVLPDPFGGSFDEAFR